MSILGDRLRIPTREELEALSPAERAELIRWATPRIVPEFFPVVPHPPQQLFLWMQNLEAFYGGAGGGGKSIALLLAALQYVDVPGYNALILRRTFADLILPGALMDRARELLMDTSAVPIDGGKAWEFPSKARITFGYAQYHNEIYRYRSAEFQFCVERGTGVKMADGTSRPIETIKPGDMVATLEGPRPVTRLHHVGLRPGWRVSTPRGATVVGERHRLLSPRGWVSPQEIASRAPGASPTFEGSVAQHPGTPLRAPSTPTGSVPLLATPLPTRAGTLTLDSSAWSRDAESGVEGCCGSPQEDELPQAWFFPVMLAEPGLQSELPLVARHECGCGLSDSSAPGWLDGCRDRPRCRDEQSPRGTASGRDGTPSQVDAGGAECSAGLSPGGPTLLQERGQRRWTFAHPYTMEPVEVRAEVALTSAWASMAPAGVVDCWDLTVAGASHYITPSSNLVHSNCAYDELTTFPENTYRFMFGRLRRPAVPCLTCKFPTRRESSGLWKHRAKAESMCSGARPDPRAVARYPAAPDGTTVFDVPLRMRAASNPGGLGHGWVRDRFVNPLTRDPQTVFVPARLTDNPSLDAESYVESLNHLDPVERARILNGDWLVTEAGKLFQRSWFKIVPELPADARARMVRYWDLAATEVKPGRDPDWTVGALVGFHEGVWYIADLRRARSTPLGVEQLVAQTAMLDGRRVAVWIEQEPGASGKATIDTYRRRILPGFEVRGDPPSGNKAERARPVSSAAEAGNVCLVEAPWNRQFLDEAELFPTPGVHDDQVDSVSGAIAVLSVRRARLRV